MNIKDISDEDIKYFKQHIIKWGKKNFANFSWRYTGNKWHALVAEIMLQRTKAEQVAPIYKTFCEKYKFPSDYLKDNSYNPFKFLGLIWRQNEFKKLCGILAVSNIPETKKELLKLPGIGDYIASAYLSLHLNRREVIIDSNVVRIYGRYFGFLTDGETRRKAWFEKLAEKITPKKNFKAYNYGLIDFTRTVCKPRPLHENCLIRTHCKKFINVII